MAKQINNKDLEALIENCKTELDFDELIAKGVNEIYIMTDKQLLKIAQEKNNRIRKEI